MVESQIIVVDNGSAVLKAGFSGEDLPQCVFPSIIGKSDSGQEAVLIGDQAYEKRKQLKISSPIERGIIENWDDMEQIWNYTFYSKLKISPNEHAILMTEPSSNPKENREKITQYMFERYNVPAFYLAKQPVLCIYAAG